MIQLGKYDEIIKYLKKLLLSVFVGLMVSQGAFAKEIIHDGEYNFVKAQYGDAWDKEDKEIDKKLAAIREKNGGKRPNILYVLIDDVSTTGATLTAVTDVLLRAGAASVNTVVLARTPKPDG